MSVNAVVLRGTLSSDPVTRALPSGDTLTHLEVTTRPRGLPTAASVPVVCFGAPASVAALAAGTEVVVTGVVRRRFWRAGPVTRSTTEVVAQRVLPARRRRSVHTAVDRALTAARHDLGEGSDSVEPGVTGDDPG